MTADYYARSGSRWALGAELVYGPIAAELVAMSPHPLRGRTVLDAGAGTGAVSSALGAGDARVVAMDLSADMLAWNADARPPCAVADIRALPLAKRSVDDAIAAFVLNHLTDPVAGLAELARVTRPGGAILAAVFSNDSRSQARDRIDALATAAGWRVPGWYTELKATAVPILGSRPAMAAAARQAGLADVHAEERPVDVGVTEPGQLVRYRLGQPVFADWLDEIGPAQAAAFAAATEQAIRDDMQPYRPLVVFLSARAPRVIPSTGAHRSGCHAGAMAAETDEMRARRRRRRALFDGVADRYRASRRGYPPESVRFIIDTARLVPGRVVLEVGCGTGQLTGQLAAHGLAVRAIDIGAGMIAAARRSLSGSPVLFQVVSFEELDAPAASFDLIISATAFHWVDPEVKFAKSARLLKAGGWLALLSTEEQYDEPLGSDLRDMWAARSESGHLWPVPSTPPAADLTGAAVWFGPPIERSYAQRMVLPAETVIGVETTRATFLSWPEHIQQDFAGDLRRHLQHRADVHLTQQTSLAMTQILPGK